MLIFAPNSDVVLEFDMVDPATYEPLTVTSATFQAFDDEGVEVVASTAVTVDGGEDVLNVTILAVDNALGGAGQGARTVLLHVATDTGSVTLSQTYVLEQFAFLTVPAQSALTLAQSMMLSRNLAQSVLEAWEEFDDTKRQAALREAWSRLSRLKYNPWHDYETIPGDISTEVKAGQFRLNEMAAEDWLLLPGHFTDALKRAQLIEASVILEGDPTWDRRQDGLISKTVGESSEMFVSKKAAMSSVSPKAHREIRGYVKRSIVIGRA